MQGEERVGILTGTEGDSFPLMEIRPGETEAPERWDYVLVADRCPQRSAGQASRQQHFLQELEGKGFRYKMIEDREKVFFGIRADSRIFELYHTLLMEPEGPAARVQPTRPAPVPATTRIRIVNFVLNSKTAAGDTLEDLVKSGVFETRFALHEGEEGLKKNWAQWRNMVRSQPIDDIRDYFGEKVALYFAWLGWYTYMLVPAAVVGLVVFLSGFSLFNASQISKEICEAHDVLLCPRGDHSRRYQQLSDTCTFAKLTHLFDNEGTVLFAIFMALWATVFLEIWKRQRARVVLHWDLYGWDEDQEEMALEFINCPDYKLRPHQHSYLRSSVILVLSLFMICLLIGMAHLLVVYRVLAAALFNSALLFQEEQVTTAVVVTGALVHYVAILIMTKINKINGHPGKSVRLAGLWKLEECHLSGCMMDLFLQMAIIMGLKQTLSNCAEYLSPWLAHKWRVLRFRLGRPSASGEPELRDLRRNYLLNPVGTFSLFDEFMEMMIQYGFTTIFVAAFPLAPLLALFSNLVEIRLDAIKMVRLQRRLVPRKAKDIGTWLQVLETIGVLAVIANGMVIAFTSEFIPRVVYKYHYGPCRMGAQPAVDCLTGYVNHSLSVFYTKDFQDPIQTEGSENVTLCRYRDYRNAQDYNLSEQFWVLLAIRLVFLILFEPLCPAPPARGLVHQAHRGLVCARRPPVRKEQGPGGEVPDAPGEDALQPQEHRGVGEPEPVGSHRCHLLPPRSRHVGVPGGRCPCGRVCACVGSWRAGACEVFVSNSWGLRGRSVW
ncbi:anoctamin-9 isoform X2 [Meles meles]|uniref:anoctamin-9 isoform X2 n=1 Tax=Meles meles TaxID=9662 RepID=UPI001E69F487|nr:anoctamin-9 isoform X2 [Meles meles]